MIEYEKLAEILSDDDRRFVKDVVERTFNCLEKDNVVPNLVRLRVIIKEIERDIEKVGYEEWKERVDFYDWGPMHKNITNMTRMMEGKKPFPIER